ALRMRLRNIPRDLLIRPRTLCRDDDSGGTDGRRMLMTQTTRALSSIVMVLALLYAGCDRIESGLIPRGAARALPGDRNALLDDGKLHVVLCGTGSPLADPQRAGPCTAVLAGGHFLLVDVGPGSWREVALLRLPRARLEAVLLTHFHSDHIGELG